MTMLVPAATDAGEVRDLSASGPAESKKSVGDRKHKASKGFAPNAFSSTLQAAERAQKSSRTDSKMERMESRPGQESRRRVEDDHRERLIRMVSDRRFSDDGFSDDEGEETVPRAVSVAGDHDGDKGSEAAITGSVIAEQPKGLLSQDRLEPLVVFQVDWSAPEQWAWLMGVNRGETIGIASLESEATQDGRDTMASSEPMSSRELLTPDFETGVSVLEGHDVVAQGQDEHGAGFIPTQPSVASRDVRVDGLASGSAKEHAHADSSPWPLDEQLNRLSSTGAQEPPLARNLPAIELSLKGGHNDPSSKKLDRVTQSPRQEEPISFSVGPDIPLRAVALHAVFPGEETPSEDLLISSSGQVNSPHGENQMLHDGQLKRDNEIIRTELSNQPLPDISLGSGQEPIMRLLQRQETVSAMSMLPPSAPAEERYLGDGTPTLRVTPTGFAQDRTGAIVPRAVAFEVAEPELGHVTVRVAVKNELVHAHVLSDRPEVAAYLATGYDRLQLALQASGLAMGDFSVDVDRHGSNQSFDQNASPEQRWSWQPEQQTPEALRDQADWSRRPDSLHAGLLNVIA
ncbi:MAG: flagellar hook-length control protein FliK [Nitrospira sp.]